MKRITGFIIFYLCPLYLLTSCDQQNPDPKINFIGKNYDERLLGKWERRSMFKDWDNSMTLLTDIMLFQQNNMGQWDTFHFNELKEQNNFAFYTEQDSLYIQLKDNVLRWKYLIKEDTLIMTSFIPESLKYLDEVHFTSNYIKVYK